MRFVIGLLLVLSASGQNYKNVTVCAAGCDYPSTLVGFYNAMQDAAAYQDSMACIPYVIEGSGAIAMTSGIYFPAKKCAQFVEIRSSRGAQFKSGQRYNPATDDANAFTLKITVSGVPIYTAGGTTGWRLRNVNMITAAAMDGPVATYPVTSATWSGGVETLTIGAHLVGGTYNCSGISPAGYNFSLSLISGETANTISFNQGVTTADPGPYVGGGTCTMTNNYASSAFIQWGDGFDANVYPSGLEIIQCGFRAGGVGDAYRAFNISGHDVRIVDSYLSGFSSLSSDAQAITTIGSRLTVRNSYLSAVDEDAGIGGTLVPAGYVPSFLYFLGNQFEKQPWMDRSNGAGPPDFLCYGGKIYHDDTANVDYVCSSSGSWIAQAGLDYHAVGPYPRRYPKNHLESKISRGLRIAGNDMGRCPAETTQTCEAIILEEVTQPFIPSSGLCPPGIPQPCANVSQPWTTLSDVKIWGNSIHENTNPIQIGYSYYPPCPYLRAQYGNTRWTVTGDGSTKVTGTGLPIGYSTWPFSGSSLSSVLVDGVTMGVANVAADGLSMVVGASVPSGTHQMVIPCYDAHHDISFTNNLITKVADELTYCAAYTGSTYCTIAKDCGNNCGAGGLVMFDSGDHDIEYSHNTHVTSKGSPASGLTIYGAVNLSNTNDYSGTLIVRDNIMSAGVQGFRGGIGGGCGMEAMVQPAEGVIDLRKNIINSESVTGQTWQAFARGPVSPGCTTPSIWPADHAGGMSWMSILDPVTFRVSNPAYQGWATDGKDPGADIDLVNALTAGAVSGAHNPKLD